MKNKNKIVLVLLLVIIVILGYLAWQKGFGFFTWEKPENPAKKEIIVGVPRVMSISAQIKEAEKLINDSQFTQASVLLAGIIKENPQSILPYYYLGEIYVQTQDFDRLNRLISQIESKFPEEKLASELKIKKLVAENNFKDVLAIVSSMENPSFELQFYQALISSLQNNHEESREILKKLAKVKVDEKLSKNSEEKASKNFMKKVKALLDVYKEFDKFADGKNPHLFSLISQKLSENNEAVLAKEFASIAIKEDPEYTDGWVLRGYSEYLMENYNESLSDLYKAYELDPSRPEVYYFLALSLEKNGNLNEAALFFEKALEFDFEFSSEIRWKLVDIFIAQEKYDKASKIYQELVKENPDPEKFISATSNLIKTMKNPTSAIELTKNLINENPEDVLALNLNAWSLIENENLDEAEIVLEEAEKLEPENPRTALNFGLLYEKHQDFAQARKWYKKSYEYGLGRGYDEIVNLAAEKYNKLIDQENVIEVSPADKKSPNSP